ncbi:MAG: membrane protein insertase YidC [Candidatus Vogelbacteria bacterium]|nr:membrane protein insertase YidC [Candidatus Vogelbacteria bacterium]
MISSLFNSLLVTPFYNILIILTGIIPGADIGVAIVILTILVKILLLPLYQQSLKTQKALKKIEPELTQIKEKYKDNKVEQTRLILELYQKYQIHPLSSVLMVFIQIPIILALFFVFRDSLTTTGHTLYFFVIKPEIISTHFLGLIDITTKSVWFAGLTALTQGIYLWQTVPKPEKKELGQSWQKDFQHGMSLQMRYGAPVLIFFVSWGFPIAVSLYWITSNIFASGFELIKKQFED